MPEIIKTEAVVLSKMNYGDTSKIAVFYSKDYGKFSAIIKGARKSKIGLIIDPLNYVQVIIYRKESRDLQYVSQADLVMHYKGIKDDLNKIKYASAVLELIQYLIPENESNEKIFRGVIRILKLFETSNEQPAILLLKFILFILKETGFDLQIDKCSICQKVFLPGERIFYNFDKGFFCDLCRNQQELPALFVFEPELFNLFLCLRNIKVDKGYGSKEIDKALYFLEKYLNYHIPEFKCIKSIHLF